MIEAKRTVVVIVTGSVAAYKAPLIVRRLVQAGHRVRCVMTRSATAFVGPSALSAITGEAVLTSGAGPETAGELHIELATEADCVLVVACTADFLARLATGRADDLAAATCLSTRAPLLIAPAMHPNMWSHPATMRNVATLTGDGRITWLGPVEGEVLSGDVGRGRMEEPEAIVQATLATLRRQAPRPSVDSGSMRSELACLEGRHVVVTAGPTVEDVDPVRFISNRSSGKMGYAIAEAAARRGARVTLISGPTALVSPCGVDRVDVRGALEMLDALWAALGSDLGGADALIMAAAVGDYRPSAVLPNKWKRSSDAMTLTLIPNPDLLAEIGKRRDGRAVPRLIGFAVETTDDAGLIASARKKIEQKRVDWVVANRASDAFGKDDNSILVVDPRDVEAWPNLPKSALAGVILDRLARELARGGTRPSGGPICEEPSL